MAALALGIGLVLRYGPNDLPATEAIVLALAVFCVISAVVFRLFGLARGMWRFASLTDLRQIALAATVVVAAFLFAMFAINRLDAIPRSVPVITWFVLVVLLGGPRILYRMWKDGGLDVVRRLGRLEPEAQNLLLLGSVSEADHALRSLGSDAGRRYRVVGIVEMQAKKTGRWVRGVEVLGEIDRLPDVVQRLAGRGLAPQALVLTKSDLQPAALRHLTEQAVALRLPVRRLASAPGLDRPEPSLEAITIDDLLGRPAVRFDVEPVRRLIAGRVVLVTGAGGSIGSEIVRQVAGYGPKRIVLLDHGELALYEVDRLLAERFPAVERVGLLASVRDADRIGEIFREQQPALVFHAAALKHVPLVEANVAEGVLTNVFGTQIVADAAVAAGAEAVVVISTDKAIRPTSVMGASKRLAEMYCQGLDAEGGRTRFITVRFGNVLGSTGSVVPLFKRQIAAGGPVTVTHPDMRRYFMTVAEATSLVLQAAAIERHREERRGLVFVLDMGEPVRIVDLARTMIVLAGLRPDVDVPITFTGLRPGEKLFEELFDGGERRNPAAVEGVFVARAQMVERARLRGSLDRLALAAQRGDERAVRQLLAELVPEMAVPAAPRRSVA
ncbi:MAG: polysaccharide biosynthesis protein [Geminicoccaceae bacterium]|nr:MAG: polysaccharide biosynthesis protein [Geminicoccaceae bacterium]